MRKGGINMRTKTKLFIGSEELQIERRTQYSSNIKCVKCQQPLHYLWKKNIVNPDMSVFNFCLLRDKNDNKIVYCTRCKRFWSVDKDTNALESIAPNDYNIRLVKAK